jgi:hypothetical protein
LPGKLNTLVFPTVETFLRWLARLSRMERTLGGRVEVRGVEIRTRQED